MVSDECLFSSVDSHLWLRNCVPTRAFLVSPNRADRARFCVTFSIVEVGFEGIGVVQGIPGLFVCLFLLSKDTQNIIYMLVQPQISHQQQLHDVITHTTSAHVPHMTHKHDQYTSTGTAFHSNSKPVYFTHNPRSPLNHTLLALCKN
mmetsp:Transcript_9621/g.15772  ORF Transcript_9621/g.15772 Transcript_9621/m.15772 type:complete len:147 (+) Transcript_9621:881-1321(+)